MNGRFREAHPGPPMADFGRKPPFDPFRLQWGGKLPLRFTSNIVRQRDSPLALF